MLNQAKHKLIINHYRNPQNQTNVKLQDYHQFEKNFLLWRSSNFASKINRTS